MFKLFPNDEVCKDAVGEHSVPAYAYKKEYAYGLVDSKEEEKIQWKEAENPWSNLLFKSALNMSKADNKLYADSVCTNTYNKGQREGEIIYLLECSSHGVCWKTGQFHYIHDPPGTKPHLQESVWEVEKEVYCEYCVEQSLVTWGLLSFGTIAGALRAVIFVNMMLYAAFNVAPMVADAVKDSDVKRKSKVVLQERVGIAPIRWRCRCTPAPAQSICPVILFMSAILVLIARLVTCRTHTAATSGAELCCELC